VSGCRVSGLFGCRFPPPAVPGCRSASVRTSVSGAGFRTADSLCSATADSVGSAHGDRSGFRAADRVSVPARADRCSGVGSGFPPPATGCRFRHVRTGVGSGFSRPRRTGVGSWVCRLDGWRPARRTRSGSGAADGVGWWNFKHPEVRLIRAL